MLAKFFINFSSSLSYMERTLDSRSSVLAKALTVNDSAICLCFRCHFDLLSFAIIGLGVRRSSQEFTGRVINHWWIKAYNESL
jgi:hypothetical protein